MIPTPSHLRSHQPSPSTPFHAQSTGSTRGSRSKSPMSSSSATHIARPVSPSAFPLHVPFSLLLSPSTPLSSPRSHILHLLTSCVSLLPLRMVRSPRRLRLLLRHLALPLHFRTTLLHRGRSPLRLPPAARRRHLRVLRHLLPPSPRVSRRRRRSLLRRRRRRRSLADLRALPRSRRPVSAHRLGAARRTAGNALPTQRRHTVERDQRNGPARGRRFSDHAGDGERDGADERAGDERGPAGRRSVLREVRRAAIAS